MPSTQRIPILMYHYLGEPRATDMAALWVKPAEFERQMRWLALGGYRTVTLHELLGALRHGRPLPGRPVVITFDDGHASFADSAAPVLARFGFTATMFVITGKIGAPNFLDADAIRRLAGAGMQFESHTVSHPVLTEIGDEEARREIVDSKAALEQVLGAPVRFFAYRGGHYNDTVKQLVEAAGYEGAVSTRPGLNGQGADPFALYRMRVRRGDGLLNFSRALSGNAQANRGAALLRHLLRV